MMLGVDVALMTRKSKIVEVRAAEVGIKRVIQAKDKVTKLQEVAGELGIGLDEICFVGDEIIDMGVMKQVGFAVSPANGVPEVQEVSHLVTKRAGAAGGNAGASPAWGHAPTLRSGPWNSYFVPRAHEEATGRRRK
jgi:3-deoxy-D-manno-octulosonate 8-phosphate phosphatase (KDO 8-P phosphatase)